MRHSVRSQTDVKKIVKNNGKELVPEKWGHIGEDWEPHMRLGKAAQGTRFVVLLGEDRSLSVTEEGTVGCPGEMEFSGYLAMCWVGPVVGSCSFCLANILPPSSRNSTKPVMGGTSHSPCQAMWVSRANPTSKRIPTLVTDTVQRWA